MEKRVINLPKNCGIYQHIMYTGNIDKIWYEVDFFEINM